MKLTEQPEPPKIYEDKDYDQLLRKTDSNQTRRDKYIMAGDWDMDRERVAFVNTPLYKTNGTPGVSGAVVYLKSGSTLGTLSFTNGIITSIT